MKLSPGVPDIRHNIKIDQYGGEGPMLNARGKTFLNLVEDLTEYLLAFLAPNYLSNSQSYVIIKFGTRLSSKFDQNVQQCQIPVMCAARGKLFLKLVAHALKSVFRNFREHNSQNDKTADIMSLALFAPSKFPQNNQLAP